MGDLVSSVLWAYTKAVTRLLLHYLGFLVSRFYVFKVFLLFNFVSL